MSHYVPVSIEDLREAFSKKTASGAGWKESVQGSEIVFDYECAPNVIVRVYSSCRVDREVARGKGHDAIRVCAVDYRNPNQSRGLVKSSRVYRVEGWRENLRSRIKTVHGLVKQRLQPTF